MSDWIDQYTAALDIRDAREQAHKPYIDAYTKLADRTAAASALTTPSRPPQPEPSTQPPPPQSTKLPSRSKPTSPTPPPQEATVDTLFRLRTDLALTQKARSTLTTRVASLTAELSDLSTAQKSSAAQIALLTSQKSALERRLRDREEELRGKQKLVEDAQDEMVAQGLQMNLAEEKAARLEGENRELVDRWVRKMEGEAERVNRESEWR
ncbi:autophagy protein 16, interacts with Atg12p-Atg5p [Saxophila tyrrhenica]|uniref:Autophagy protein 16, interacts with Atg12p-Atg5p n=1 Tax=Saxophila tyrrhenica TaxID=1690608 RepID=A0AAV9P403_9PEZI|nr:autophagy protein 16, interacts with Atg12p-Atg5p [Saxophila tyrrhenica]